MILPPGSYRRVMVMGPCGSGKSTLARRIGGLLDLPVTHMDQLRHGPGWVERSQVVFEADLLDCRIERPACMETTAQGAAALAALALGWQSPASLAARPAERVFTPAMPAARREQLLFGWRKAVSRAARWEEPTDGPDS